MILSLLLACASPPEARFDRDEILGRVLARVDTDKDGRVTAEEYARVDFSGPTFVEADTDGDGALSIAELRTMTLAQDPTTFYRAPDLVLKSGKTIPGSGGNADAVKHDGPAGGPGGGGAQGGPGGGAEGGPGGPGGGGPGGGAQGGPGGGGPGGGGPGGPGGGAPGGPGGEAKGAPGGGGGKKTGDRMQPPVSLLVLRILHAEVASVDPTIPLPSEEEMNRIGYTNTLESEEAVALLRALEEAAAKANVGFPATLRAATRASRPAAPAGIPATTAADP
ncbi:MAG: hypothetical protein V4850_11100 [Myxococcota bacterium]